jgi:hypothetical protein
VKDEDEARQLRIDETKRLSKGSQDSLGTVIKPEVQKTEVKEPAKKSGGN